MKKLFTILVYQMMLIIFSNQLYSQNIGPSAYINLNEIYLPFNNRGVIADVNVTPYGSQGQFAGINFLFSSGFWLSGYTYETLWANGVATASLVEDYQAGIVGMDPSDPQASIYRVMKMIFLSAKAGRIGLMLLNLVQIFMMEIMMEFTIRWI